MSAVMKSEAPLALVTSKPSLPQRVDDPASIEFMHADLARSGLTPEDVRGYPIAPQWSGEGAYVLDYGDPDGMYRVRYDTTDKNRRYRGPQKLLKLWVPVGQTLDLAPGASVFIIEGEKKASAFKKAFPEKNVFGIGGSHNFAKDGVLLPDLLAVLRPRMAVSVIFDGDIESNIKIYQAALKLQELLRHLNCDMLLFKPPQGKGVDDWLVADPERRLAPEPITKTLLDDPTGVTHKLAKMLGCSMNKDDRVIMNEVNAGIILGSIFKGSLTQDRRLGLLLDGVVKSIDDLENEALVALQSVFPNYKKAQILGGVRLLISPSADLVADTVRGTKWDGVERLDTWALDYLVGGGDTFPKFIAEWGRLLMTGMGLRILRPGTKVDYAFILTGRQGIGKSTFFEALATFGEHQLYYPITDFSGSAGDANRTEGIAFRKSVIVDLAEGVIFRSAKTNIDLFKQRISQTHDSFREVYSKGTVDVPRGFVFVGTANRADLFSDQGGSRRFLVLWLEGIKRLPYEIKLQLLAEVCAKEQALHAADWWKLRITLDDLPKHMRDRAPTVTDVQEVMNAGFQQIDPLQERLVEQIERGALPQYKGCKKPMFFVTAYYLCYLQFGDDRDTPQNRRLLSNILSGMSNSNITPFEIIKTGSEGQPRPSRNQLTMGATDSTRFFDPKSADQQNGWWLIPKERHEHG